MTELLTYHGLKKNRLAFTNIFVKLTKVNLHLKKERTQ